MRGKIQRRIKHDFNAKSTFQAFIGEEAKIMAQMIIAELYLLSSRKEAAFELISQGTLLALFLLVA